MTSNSGANTDIEGHDAACELGERENRGGCAGSDVGEDADPSLKNSRRDLQQLNQSLDSWHQFPAEATPSSIWNKNLQGGNQVLVPEDGDGEADRLLVGSAPAVEGASTAVGAAEAGSAAVSVGAAADAALVDTDVVVADDTRNGLKQVEDKADKSEDDLDHIIGRSANMTMPDGAGFGAPAMTDEVDENSAGGTTTSAGADGNCGNRNHHISTSSCNSSLGASGSGSRGSGSAQMKSSSRGKNMQSFNPPPRPLTSSTPQHQYNQHRGPRGSGGSTYNHSYAAGTAGGSTTNKGNGKKGGHGGCGGYKNQYHQHHAVGRGQQQHGHINQNQNHNQLQQRRGGPGYGQHQQQHQQGGGGGAYHNQHTNSRFGGQRGQQGGNNYDSYGAPTTTSAQQHNVAHATTHQQHNPNSHSSTTPTTYSFNQHAAERYRSSQGSSYNGAPGVQNNNQQWHNQHQNSSNSRHQEGGHNYGQQHQHGEMMNNGGGGAPVSTWSSSSGGAAGATSTYQQMHGSYHQQQQSQNGTASMGNQHTCTSTTPGYPHQGNAQHHQLHQNHNLHQQVAQQQPQNQGQNMLNQPHQQQHNVMPNNSGASTSHQVDHADHLHQEQLLLQQQQHQQVHHQSNVNLNMNNNQHQPPLIQQPQHSFVPNGGGPAAQIPPFSAGGGTAGGMPGTSGTTSSNMDGKSMNYHVQLEKAVRSKRVEEAWATLEEMQFEGIVCDKFAISRILMKTVNHYHEPKLLQRGIQVVERFVHQQPGDVDEVLFNSLLDACCRTRDMARLESILRQMRANGIQPSSVTLGILVKAYGQAGDIDSVWREWLRLKESLHENANAVTFGCMLDACVKCGDIEKALFVFQDIKRIGKHHNTILYTTLMKGYGMARNLEGALMLFNEMKQERVAVNTITFNSMIDVAVRAHDCDKAEELCLFEKKFFDREEFAFTRLFFDDIGVKRLIDGMDLCSCEELRRGCYKVPRVGADAWDRAGLDHLLHLNQGFLPDWPPRKGAHLHAALAGARSLSRRTGVQLFVGRVREGQRPADGNSHLRRAHLEGAALADREPEPRHLPDSRPAVPPLRIQRDGDRSPHQLDVRAGGTQCPKNPPKGAANGQHDQVEPDPEAAAVAEPQEPHPAPAAGWASAAAGWATGRHWGSSCGRGESSNPDLRRGLQIPRRDVHVHVEYACQQFQHAVHGEWEPRR